MVAELTKKKSIDHIDFMVFLRRLHDFTKGEKSLVMLDNLPVHKKLEVRACAKQYNFELIFNGTYSSKYMPIERLWAWAKGAFTK